jgi:DNA-binding MarR family transcriptional regulator
MPRVLVALYAKVNLDPKHRVSMKGVKDRRAAARRAVVAISKRTKAPKAPSLPLSVGILPNLLGYNVRRAEIALWRDFSRTVGEGEVRPALFSLMILVEANPGLAQIDIANQLDIDKATVVGLVQRLQRRQCVVCRQSAVDRRRQGIFLTDRGQKELDKLRQEMLDHETRFTRLFSAQELAQLFTLLRRIHP